MNHTKTRKDLPPADTKISVPGYSIKSHGDIVYTLINPEGKAEIWSYRANQPKTRSMPFGNGYLKFIFDVATQNGKHRELGVENGARTEAGEHRDREDTEEVAGHWERQWRGW